jgi:signal transduction histidine kinase/ABC-type amino acid transport substrate-binding protein
MMGDATEPSEAPTGKHHPMPVLSSSAMLARRLGRAAVLMALVLCLPGTAPSATGHGAGGTERIVRVGVLAYRGAAQARSRWAATVDHLTHAVPGHRFELKPFGLDGLERAVAAGEVDFVLTNPGHYVVLEARHGVTRIVTLRNRVGEHVLTRFGAVIFTRADHPEIRTLDDLDGRSFMAVSPRAFGGFQMAWLELKRQGIDPFEDLGELRFVGFPQDAIVRAVVEGRVDAGTVRTDTLERMAREGGLSLDRVRVLNRRREPGFPFLLSTALYPEWPFSRLRETPEALAQQVAVALLTLDPDSSEARAAGTAGWTIPLDYTPVHALYRELDIGPYAQPFTLIEVVHEYAPWLLAWTLGFLILSAATLWTLRMNRRLAQEVAERERAQRALARHRDLLEQRVAERTADLRRVNERLAEDIRARERAEQALRRSDAVLKRLHAIVGDPDLDSVTRMRQMLEAMCEYGRLDAGVLAKVDGNTYEVCTWVGTLAVEAGQRWPLEALPAAAVLRDGDVVAGPLEDAGPLGRWRFHVGVPVRVGDQVRCVLEFFGDAPALASPMDRDVLLLVAQWIGAELARSDADEQLRRHQEELAHVGRLSAVGEMATSLAHELNQPLTAVVNYVGGSVRRLRAERAADPRLLGAMERAMAEATRAGRIIRHLREFVRKAPFDESRVDVAAAVTAAAELVAHEAKRKGVALRTEADEALPPVRASQIQIEQVLVNLLRNAIDAVAQGDAGGEVRVRARFGDGRVHIEVSDSGPGLPPRVLERLFEPFFTTKPQGMGMGLNITRTIVEGLGGRIEAANRPQGGAVFTVILPVREDDE